VFEKAAAGSGVGSQRLQFLTSNHLNSKNIYWDYSRFMQRRC